MTSIKQASFPFKAGKNYPFYKVDFDYNFSKVQKIVNLETYLFLAVDQQFNLHFIQYRDPYPHEKPVIPPSFALKGTGHIKFSLEYHVLKAFLYNIKPENVDMSGFFSDRRAWQEDLPNIFYIGEDRLLIKLSSKDAAFMIYYDHRLESEDRRMIPSLETGTNIAPVDSHRAILYKTDKNMAVLTCTLSQKVKMLNFTHSRRIDDIKVLAQHDIAIGSDSFQEIEILDLRKNKVIEKILLVNPTNPQIIVDEVDHSGKFIISYRRFMRGEGSDLLLTVWRTLPDRTVRSSEEINLVDFNIDVVNVIGFLNKDYIVILGYTNELGIFRLDEKGIIRIHKTTMNFDPDYLPDIRSGNLHNISRYSCFKVLDEKTFVAVRARADDTSTDHQQIVVFNYTFGADSKKENGVEESKLTEPKKFNGITAKVLINHTPDKVLGITHWEDKFVAFFTRSKKLYHYDLQTGKLRHIVTLKATDKEESFVSMNALKGKYVAIHFKHKYDERSDRFLVFDIQKNALHCDSSSPCYFWGQIRKCSLSPERIFVMYLQSYHDVVCAFGEVDIETRKITFLSKYPDRALLSNLIVTPNLIAIGTAPLRINDDDEEYEKVVFYSLKEQKLLYEMNIDDLAPEDNEPENRVRKIVHITDNLIALLHYNPMNQDEWDEKHDIVLWDVQKRYKVAENPDILIKRILGSFKDHLLYTDLCVSIEIDTKDTTSFLDLSPYLKNRVKKEEPDDLEVLYEIWDTFDPDLRCIDTLTPWLPVFVGYDKRIYPNSLLFFRRKTWKTECLRIIHKKIGKVYNPYIRRQVIDMIFPPEIDDSSIEEEEVSDEAGEAKEYETVRAFLERVKKKTRL